LLGYEGYISSLRKLITSIEKKKLIRVLV